MTGLIGKALQMFRARCCTREVDWRHTANASGEKWRRRSNDRWGSGSRKMFHLATPGLYDEPLELICYESNQHVHVSPGEILAMSHTTILLVEDHARLCDQHVLWGGETANGRITWP